MYLFEPVCILLTLCGLEKMKNKLKPVHPILFFEVIKDVCCMITPSWNQSSSRKSLKSPNYHD